MLSCLNRKNQSKEVKKNKAETIFFSKVLCNNRQIAMIAFNLKIERNEKSTKIK